MSLLMDALKKAELAKRKTEADNAATTPPAPAFIESSSPPPPAAETASPGSIDFEPQLFGDRLPDAPLAAPDYPAEPTLSLNAVSDDDFVSMQKLGITRERRRHNRQPERTAPEVAHTDLASEDVTNREAIKNLFETKQPSTSHKTFAISAGVVTILAIAAIGWYFWNQLQPTSGLLADPGRNIVRPSPPASVIPPQPEPSLPVASIPEHSLYSDETRPVREISEAEETRSPATIPAERKLFQLSKSAAPQTDPALERGFSALNRGDTTTARNAYEQALGNDPRNTDALSGLAVLAQRAGNADQAADYYLRLLEADPHNAFALAGLIGMHAVMNPADAETRLKQALSSQPESAPLNFSLGNICAAQKRWPEAQHAYFKAVAADPGNPDFLFNLAVSLDQLHQPRLAASYYAQAMAAAGRRPASFDLARASERLRQLQQ